MFDITIDLEHEQFCTFAISLRAMQCRRERNLSKSKTVNGIRKLQTSK